MIIKLTLGQLVYYDVDRAPAKRDFLEYNKLALNFVKNRTRNIDTINLAYSLVILRLFLFTLRAVFNHRGKFFIAESRMYFRQFMLHFLKKQKSIVFLPYKWMPGFGTNFKHFRILLHMLVYKKYNESEESRILKKVGYMIPYMQGVSRLRTSPNLVFVPSLFFNKNAYLENFALRVPVMSFVTPHDQYYGLTYPVPGTCSFPFFQVLCNLVIKVRDHSMAKEVFQFIPSKLRKNVLQKKLNLKIMESKFMTFARNLITRERFLSFSSIKDFLFSFLQKYLKEDIFGGKKTFFSFRLHSLLFKLVRFFDNKKPINKFSEIASSLFKQLTYLPFLGGQYKNMIYQKDVATFYNKDILPGAIGFLNFLNMYNLGLIRNILGTRFTLLKSYMTKDNKRVSKEVIPFHSFSLLLGIPYFTDIMSNLRLQFSHLNLHNLSFFSLSANLKKREYKSERIVSVLKQLSKRDFLPLKTPFFYSVVQTWRIYLPPFKVRKQRFNKKSMYRKPRKSKFDFKGKGKSKVSDNLKELLLSDNSKQREIDFRPSFTFRELDLEYILYKISYFLKKIFTFLNPSLIPSATSLNLGKKLEERNKKIKIDYETVDYEKKFYDLIFDFSYQKYISLFFLRMLESNFFSSSLYKKIFRVRLLLRLHSKQGFSLHHKIMAKRRKYRLVKKFTARQQGNAYYMQKYPFMRIRRKSRYLASKIFYFFKGKYFRFKRKILNRMTRGAIDYFKKRTLPFVKMVLRFDFESKGVFKEVLAGYILNMTLKPYRYTKWFRPRFLRYRGSWLDKHPFLKGWKSFKSFSVYARVLKRFVKEKGSIITFALDIIKLKRELYEKIKSIRIKNLIFYFRPKMFRKKLLKYKNYINRIYPTYFLKNVKLHGIRVEPFKEKKKTKQEEEQEQQKAKNDSAGKERKIDFKKWFDMYFSYRKLFLEAILNARYQSKPNPFIKLYVMLDPYFMLDLLREATIIDKKEYSQLVSEELRNLFFPDTTKGPPVELVRFCTKRLKQISSVYIYLLEKQKGVKEMFYDSVKKRLKLLKFIRRQPFTFAFKLLNKNFFKFETLKRFSEVVKKKTKMKKLKLKTNVKKKKGEDRGKLEDNSNKTKAVNVNNSNNGNKEKVENCNISEQSESLDTSRETDEEDELKIGFADFQDFLAQKLKHDELQKKAKLDYEDIKEKYNMYSSAITHGTTNPAFQFTNDYVEYVKVQQFMDNFVKLVKGFHIFSYKLTFFILKRNMEKCKKVMQKLKTIVFDDMDKELNVLKSTPEETFFPNRRVSFFYKALNFFLKIIVSAYKQKYMLERKRFFYFTKAFFKRSVFDNVWKASTVVKKKGFFLNDNNFPVNKLDTGPVVYDNKLDFSEDVEDFKAQFVLFIKRIALVYCVCPSFGTEEILEELMLQNFTRVRELLLEDILTDEEKEHSLKLFDYFVLYKEYEDNKRNAFAPIEYNKKEYEDFLTSLRNDKYFGKSLRLEKDFSFMKQKSRTLKDTLNLCLSVSNCVYKNFNKIFQYRIYCQAIRNQERKLRVLWNKVEKEGKGCRVLTYRFFVRLLKKRKRPNKRRRSRTKRVNINEKKVEIPNLNNIKQNQAKKKKNSLFYSRRLNAARKSEQKILLEMRAALSKDFYIILCLGKKLGLQQIEHKNVISASNPNFFPFPINLVLFSFNKDDIK